MFDKLREISQSLTVRIAALLALALMPIGVIAFAFTVQILNQSDRRAESNILTRTAAAAAPEEALIRTSLGAANLLSALIQDLKDEADCGESLRTFLDGTKSLSFAGYVDPTGTLACASRSQGQSVVEHPVVQQMFSDPRSRIILSPALVGGSTLNIITAVPVSAGGIPDGFVVVSLSHGDVLKPESAPAERQIDLLTFNAETDLLTSSVGLEAAASRLPTGTPLESVLINQRSAFIDRTRDGTLRVFAVVPIVPGQVFALGSWPHSRENLLAGLSATGFLAFPIAMWIICLLVAFYAVQRMVIRPMRNLRARMLQFMRSRRLSEPRSDRFTPRELRDMDDTWMRLAENVLQDEAKLYDTIHQRTVLLKEVHHRVKNNLQLIVSILNMKVRKARDIEVRTALNEIRQRVMGIARVHQNLYETSTTERVQAAELLPVICEQIIKSGIDNPDTVDISQHYDPLVIYPDQAVPLSLAATELLTNALKNLDAADGERARLSVRLERIDDRHAKLTVCNSLSGDGTDVPEPSGTGLGLALIKAFAHQLEGESNADCTDRMFCATLTFPVAEFDATEVPDRMPVASSAA